MATGLIDAVIVDCGTPQLACRCAGSMEHGAFASVQIVDAKAREFSYSEAVNFGAAVGSAPYVLALNADCRMLEPPDHVLHIFGSHPEVAVVGPRQIDAHGMVTHAGIVGTNEQPQHRFWKVPLKDCRDQCSEFMLDCVTVSGSVYFARRSVWEELGGLLVTPGYYEETWFSYAARHRGHRVVYTGATTWEHLWHQGGMAKLDREGVFMYSREIFREACAKEGIACD